MENLVRNIIINADDFGLSNGVCKAINELLSINAITNTSLMIAAPSAIKIMQENGVKNLLGYAGVHLLLTSGKPISKISEVSSLVDNNGNFSDPRKRSDYKLDHIYIEWKHQIEIAIDLLNGLPTHLDSHHGVHRVEGIFDVYTQLAREYNIPIRGSNLPVLTEKILSNKINASIALVRNWTGKDLSSVELLKECYEIANAFSNEKYIEVISHPGFSDSYLENISSLNKSREVDFFTLREMQIKNIWESNNFKLTSYKEIQNGIFRSY
jgi:chitin disaccharide deacetylase